MLFKFMLSTAVKVRVESYQEDLVDQSWTELWLLYRETNFSWEQWKLANVRSSWRWWELEKIADCKERRWNGKTCPKKTHLSFSMYKQRYTHLVVRKARARDSLICFLTKIGSLFDLAEAMTSNWPREHDWKLLVYHWITLEWNQFRLVHIRLSSGYGLITWIN